MVTVLGLLMIIGILLFSFILIVPVLNIVNVIVKNSKFSMITFFVNIAYLLGSNTEFLFKYPRVFNISPWVPITIAGVGSIICIFRMKKKHLIISFTALIIESIVAIFIFKNY